MRNQTTAFSALRTAGSKARNAERREAYAEYRSPRDVLLPPQAQTRSVFMMRLVLEQLISGVSCWEQGFSSQQSGWFQNELALEMLMLVPRPILIFLSSSLLYWPLQTLGCALEGLVNCSRGLRFPAREWGMELEVPNHGF